MRNFEIAIFLLLCFVLGGTSQDVVAPKLPLYLLSLIIIAAKARLVLDDNEGLRKLKPVLLLFSSFLVVSAAYLVPLPPTVWSALPGRQVVAEGYSLAGMALPWMPVSLTAEKTLFSLFDFLPPLAIILMIATRRGHKEIKYGFLAIMFFVILSVVLAALQTSQISEALYFYDVTNRDAGVGFFSNTNHFGIFLIMTLPIIAALYAITRTSGNHETSWIKVMCFVATVTVVLGVSFTKSLASLMLIMPMLVFCALLLMGRGRFKKIWLFVIIGAVLLVVLSDIFLFKNMWPDLINTFGNIGMDNRQVMRSTSLEAARAMFPVGSGLGSFADVYRLFEGFGKRTVPHAHNDYVEIFVEFGLFGLIWLFALFVCAVKYSWKAFKRGGNRLSQYMSLVIGVIAIHCTVDYAPRTIAVMVLITFAACLMAAPPRRFKFSGD